MIRTAWCIAWLVSLAAAYSVGKRLSDFEAIDHENSTSTLSRVTEPTASIQSPLAGDSPLAEIVQLSRPHERDYQIALRLRRADAAHMPALLAEALALPPSVGRDDTLAAIFERWGAIAPRAGLAVTEKLTPLQRERFANAVRVGWAHADPVSALHWLQAQENVDQQENSARHRLLFSVLLDDDRRETAMRLLDAVRDDDLKATAAWEIMTRWVGQDVAAALTWIGSFPPGHSRRNAYAHAFYRISFENPAGAADLANSLTNSNDRMEALSAVVSVWAGSDAASAKAWLVSHSAAPEFQGVVGTFVRCSLSKNPDHAASMIDSIQDPKARTTQINDSIWALGFSSPAHAVQWTLRFQPPEKREAYLEGTFRQWGTRDRAGVEAFLERFSGFTAEQRVRGRESIRSAAVRR